MYGTRDAGAIWESVYTDTLLQMGFIQGIASPCCFVHREWNLQLVVHGDDFTCLGTDASLDKWESAMSAAFQVKLKGRIGHDDHDKKSMRVLNRLLTVVSNGLIYEPDPRHIELLARSLGLETCKLQTVPGIKDTSHPCDKEEEEEEQPDQQLINSIFAAPAPRQPERRTRRGIQQQLRFEPNIQYFDIPKIRRPIPT